MHILMLSRRDIENPLSAGQEEITFEILKRLAEQGHSCTWFASQFNGAQTRQTLEKVNILRKGNPFSVIFKARSFLKAKKFDIIIDQINILPFFTPLYYGKRKIAFIHQLSEKMWFYELPFPLSILGYLAEKFYIPLYRKMPTMTISNSTKNNLEKYGFKKIMVFKNCINIKPLEEPAYKEKYMLIYLGRLKKSKRVHELIHALYYVRKQVEAELHIIGVGKPKYEKYLHEQTSHYGLQTAIFFHGHLSKTKRNELLQKSEAIILASVKEGFGLAILEAASQGTPAIAYNVDGLRDAIIPNHTGLIAKENNPKALAQTIISYLRNEKLKKKLSSNAIEYSKHFNWDDSFKDVKEFIEVVGRQ